MLYAVVPLEAPDDPGSLQERILEVDGAAYTHYHPTVYFVSFTGTAEDLSKRVNFTPMDAHPGIAGVVVKIADYYGFGNKNLWDWLRSKK